MKVISYSQWLKEHNFVDDIILVSSSKVVQDIKSDVIRTRSKGGLLGSNILSISKFISLQKTDPEPRVVFSPIVLEFIMREEYIKFKKEKIVSSSLIREFHLAYCEAVSEGIKFSKLKNGMNEIFTAFEKRIMKIEEAGIYIHPEHKTRKVISALEQNKNTPSRSVYILNKDTMPLKYKGVIDVLINGSTKAKCVEADSFEPNETRRIKCAGTSDETKRVLREIKEQNLNEEITIVIPHGGKFPKLLHTQAKEYNIPLDINVSLPLLELPIGQGMLAPFQLLENELEPEKVARLIANPALITGIKDSFENTELEISKLIATIENKNAKTYNGWKNIFDTAMVYEAENPLYGFSKWWKALEGISKSKKMNAEYFYKETITLWESWRIKDWVKSNADKLNEKIVHRNTLGYSDALKGAQNAETICSVLFDNKEITLSQWTQILTEVFRSTSISYGENLNSAVKVRLPEDVSPSGSDVIYILGLNQNEFPNSALGCKILPNEANDKQQLNIDLALFNLCVSSAKNKLVAVRSHCTEAGKPVLSSLFLDTDGKLSKIEEEAFSLTDRVTPHENILSEHELLHRSALLLGGGVSKEEIPTLLATAKTLSISKSTESFIRVGKRINYRKTSNELTEFDGNLTKCEEVISKYRNVIESRNYSASSLKSFHDCPAKFFFKYILKLKTPPEKNDPIGSLNLGSVLHEVFCEFVKRGKEQKKWVWPLSDVKSSAKAFLLEVADEVIGNFTQKLQTKDKAVWDLWMAHWGQKNGLWDSFIEREASANKMQPYEFEQRIEDWVLNDEKLPFQLKIRGVIDRIDIDEETKNFSVLDYKTGNSCPSANQLKNGNDWQVPLYVRWCFEQDDFNLLEEHGAYYYKVFASLEELPSKMPILVTKAGKLQTYYDTPEIDTETPSDWDSKILPLIKDALEKMLLADYKPPISPTCEYCDYRDCCHYHKDGFTGILNIKNQPPKEKKAKANGGKK